MPLTCESWPSTSATYSCRSRSVSSRGRAGVTRLLKQMLVQPPHAVFDGDGRHEPESMSHCTIDRTELDVFLRTPLVPDHRLDAENTGQRRHDLVDRDRLAGGQIDRSAES